MRFHILLFLMFLIVPFSAEAVVAGSVVYHSGEAWALRDGDRVALKEGVEVHSGDVIVTTVSGRAKLSMVDDSVVYVGRQSRITIDKYEMRKGSLFSGSFNMLWGKVRFLVAKLNTGGSSFSVQTKTATIGVRGTQFAVLVNPPSVIPKPFVKVPDNLIPNAATTVMLFEGAVTGKSIKGQIVDITPGTIVRLKPNGAVLSRKIQKHDMKVLDIEPLALGKGALKPGREMSRSPAKLTPATTPTKLGRGSALASPARLEPATTPTTKLAPTRLEPLATVAPQKLDSLTPRTTVAPTTTPTRLAPIVAPPPVTKFTRIAPPPPVKIYTPPTRTVLPPTTTIKRGL